MNNSNNNKYKFDFDYNVKPKKTKILTPIINNKINKPLIVQSQPKSILKKEIRPKRLEPIKILNETKPIIEEVKEDYNFRPLNELNDINSLNNLNNDILNFGGNNINKNYTRRNQDVLDYNLTPFNRLSQINYDIDLRKGESSRNNNKEFRKDREGKLNNF